MSGVFDPNSFDRKLQDSAKFLKAYVEEHNAFQHLIWLMRGN